MNCTKHKKYQAKRKPRNSCRQCWLAWLKTDKSSPEDLDVFLEQDQCDKNAYIVTKI